MRRLNLKSKSVSPGRVELNYEVRLRDGDAGFVNELGTMAGVDNVVLVSYNGDYMGRAMIRHRRIDLICTLAMALALALTGLLCFGETLGIRRASAAPGTPTASLTTAGSIP